MTSTGTKRRILLWLSAATAAVTLSGCGIATTLAGSTTTATVASAPAPTVTDGPYTLWQEPQAGYGPVADLIDRASKSVALTIYQLDDDRIEQALIDAHNRGVTVTVVLDTAFHGRKVNQPAYDRLRAAAVNVTWAPAGVIVHEKALAIDDSVAVVSTANFHSRYYSTGRDAMIETRDPADVTAITATINSDYAAASTGRLSQATPAPNLIWSPAARAAFIQTINNAHHDLDLTSEEFKEHAVAIAVTHAVQRGVTCRMVLNADAATTTEATSVKQAGCVVHVLPKSSTGLYMHEKVLITDAGVPGQTTVVIGSHNIGTRSLLQNRELSIKLDSTRAPKIVAAIEDQFTADYNNSSPA